MPYINENGWPKTPGIKEAAKKVIDANDAVGRTQTNWARGGEAEPVRYRIRRCAGASDCWMLVALDSYGNEASSYGSFITSTSLDLLLKRAAHLTPNPGEHVDFVA